MDFMQCVNVALSAWAMYGTAHGVGRHIGDLNMTEIVESLKVRTSS
jgi:hypothetical protein